MCFWKGEELNPESNLDSHQAMVIGVKCLSQKDWHQYLP